MSLRAAAALLAATAACRCADRRPDRSVEGGAPGVRTEGEAEPGGGHADDHAAGEHGADGAIGPGGGEGEGPGVVPAGEGEGDGGPRGPIPPGPGPLHPRAPNRTCRIPAEPLPARIDVEEVYPRLDFERPLWFGHAGDGSSRRYVVEQGGAIHVFDDGPDPARADVFARLRVSRAGNEEGLLGLAFHPDYAANGRLFVHYSAAGPRRGVVAELRRDPGDPRRTSPEVQRIVLEVPQPYSNHNGGDLHFGPDGMLYIGLGDGGSGGDPQNHGNRPSTLLGSMLRIDVDGPPDGPPYRVPDDNPFVHGPVVAGDDAPARPEVWAYGLRNPWRFSFDPPTGDLWVGDVGQDASEEIDIVRRGEHMGWRVREGFDCFGAPGCAEQGLTPPVLSYGRALGVSVTGGWVYRGPRLPELRGAYVFGDFDSGRLWAARVQGRQAVGIVEMADTTLQISSFGVGPDGEVYVVAFNRGRSLFRLRRAEAVEAPQPFPERLSATGCFSDLAALTPASGVVPYDVNVPSWNDGADTRHWLALPDGSKMGPGAAADAPWAFPEGAVLIEHLELQGAAAAGGGPEPAPMRLETRLLVRRADRWQGYVYRWDAQGRDAVLQDGRALADVALPGGGRQTWEFPSRADCDRCHTPGAGGALGLTTRQLNRWRDYGGDAGSFPQIEALVRAGYVDLAAPSDVLPRWSPADARALLDVNCSMCHRPGGPGNARVDLRAGTPVADAALCDVRPEHGDLGLGDGARIVAPGDPARSVLLGRMRWRGEGQMPPLASRVADERTLGIVAGWIEGLEGCAP